MKDYSNVFSKQAGMPEKDVGVHQTVQFNKDEGDNYIFKEIQVEDIKTLTRPETVWYDDSDMMVYRAASMVEEKRIKVTHKKDKSIVFDCKNITEFKGRGKSVGTNTVLGLYNVDRELNNLPCLLPEDFSIEQYQIIQGGNEEKAFETAKIQILKTLKDTRLQYGLSKIIPVLGEGSSFRESLNQVKRYKSNRDDSLRPILLKRLRSWLVDEVGAVDTKDLRHKGEPIECDDYIEMKAHEGVVHFRKHGWYNIGVISKDKDATNSAKLLINNDRVGGKLKFPKAMHIQTTDKCSGDVALLSKGDGTAKDFKFYGFKGLMYQSFLGIDQADFYSALKHLDRGFDFGDVAAYKVLKPCNTAKEALQACIDVFAELLPKGVEYTNHKGEELHVDTLTYMNTYFLTAYMIRKLDDPMDLFKLCEAFKVDTSRVVNNHIEKVLPLASEESIRSTYNSACEKMVEISDILSNQKGKKDELIDRMTQANKLLEELWVGVGNGLFEENSNE